MLSITLLGSFNPLKLPSNWLDVIVSFEVKNFQSFIQVSCADLLNSTGSDFSLIKRSVAYSSLSLYFTKKLCTFCQLSFACNSRCTIRAAMSTAIFGNLSRRAASESTFHSRLPRCAPTNVSFGFLASMLSLALTWSSYERSEEHTSELQ